MTRDDIIKLALEAGIVVTGEAVWKLCELVAAAEREACARVCEEECADPDDQFKNYEDTHTDGWQDGCNSCAWAIRARGSHA